MYKPKNQQKNDLHDYFGGGGDDHRPKTQSQSNYRNQQDNQQSYNDKQYQETYNNGDYQTKPKHYQGGDNYKYPQEQQYDDEYDNRKIYSDGFNQDSRSYNNQQKYPSQQQNKSYRNQDSYSKQNQDQNYNSQKDFYQNQDSYVKQDSYSQRNTGQSSQYYQEDSYRNQDSSRQEEDSYNNKDSHSRDYDYQEHSYSTQDSQRLNRQYNPKNYQTQNSYDHKVPTKDIKNNNQQKTKQESEFQKDQVQESHHTNFDDDIYDFQAEEYDDQDYENEEVEYQDKYSKIERQQNDGELKILMVAEKNSIAEAISKALGSAINAKRGRNQCYQFMGQFRGQKASFTVTATNGHIFNRDFSKEYADWESVDPLKLFKAATLKKPASKSGTIRQLESAAKDCNYLLMWLDNDREGENICFEVEEVCRPHLRLDYKVLRAKFSSITSQDLKEAFNKIHLQPNLMESLAVDARQIIDLKIGVAFSRFQTMYFAKKYPALKDKLITYGPCQTPTLGFCVARHEEIQNFKPKVYYVIQASLQNSSGFKQNAEWEGDRIWQEKEAKDLVAKLQSYEYFDVIESSTQLMTKIRPEGVNTVNLLKFASSFLGIGPQQTMHIAEKLYLMGYLSYPRTESTTYPENFPTAQIIQELQKYETQEISKHASMLTKSEHTAPRAGKDAGDHPPITPTIVVPPKLMGHDERGIYEYIVKMFLATHSGDCQYDHSRLRVKPAREKVSFKLSGNRTIKPGFTAIASWLAVADDTFDAQKYITPKGVLVASVNYRVAQTTPPEHLSESELIGLMEQYGIGTDASMATHINNICERQYVRVELGARRLAPTELGLCLVKGYKKIDAELVAPLLRSNIEKQCDSIAKGEAQFQDVIDKVIATFEEKFISFRDNISKMDEIFAPKSVLIGKQTQAQKGRPKGGFKRGAPRRGKKQDEEEGPSHVPIQVTLADFVRPALESSKPVQQKEVQKQPAPPQVAKKNFKSKKDDENLLY